VGLTREAGLKMATSKASAQAEVITLKKWLTEQSDAASLCIPNYQRPYRWGKVQVQQLLRDVEYHARKSMGTEVASHYRMGTVVVHIEAGKRNIVDGQQRTVTLLLVLHALVRQWPSDSGLRLAELLLPHPESQEQVGHNYQLIVRHIQQAGWGATELDFLLFHCELVCVSLYDLTEAFQFFDAQNSRGKALCVHDLLKAYHLRAVPEDYSVQRKDVVKVWEQCSQAQLERLFARFLFVVRQYARGQPAEHFGSDSVTLFKGLDASRCKTWPLAKPWLMLDQGLGAGQDDALSWPCQIDMPIVNGLRFFEWVQNYWYWGFHLSQKEGELPSWVHKVAERTGLKLELPELSHEILLTLGKYKGRYRVGDTRIRELFDALLLYYVDKFGGEGLGHAIQVVFVWVYARLMSRRVRAGSVDKLLRESGINPFAVLRDAMDPQDFLQIPLQEASYETDTPLSGLEGLQRLFERSGYWSNK